MNNAQGRKFIQNKGASKMGFFDQVKAAITNATTTATGLINTVNDSRLSIKNLLSKPKPQTIVVPAITKTDTQSAKNDTYLMVGLGVGALILLAMVAKNVTD